MNLIATRKTHASLEQAADRRVYDRIPAELAVSAWSLSQPTRRLEGWTVNLGAGGALLHLPDLPPLAATLQASIDLPRERITFGADVRWREEPGLVAVQFDRISPESRAALVEYLRGLR